jgi:methyl-accepting chemotaxis protein
MAFLLSIVSQEWGCLSPHFELLRQQLMGALEITDSSMIAVIERISAVHERSRHHMDRLEQSMQTTLSLVGVAESQSDNIRQAILLIRHETQSHLDSLNRNLTRSQELADEVGELSGILTTIQNLARQSKILAINGLIEAARAPELSAAFGVVAAEMKQLSLDTTRAAADIAIKIRRLSGKMEEELDTVKTAMVTVQESAARLQSIVQDLASSEERFHSCSDQIKGAIGDIHANNTDVVAQLSEALGYLQFHDVVYQRVGQVEKALQELGEHAEAMAESTADPSWDGALHPTLKERLDHHLSTYVMASQHDTHAAVIGEDSPTHSDGPAIELF